MNKTIKYFSVASIVALSMLLVGPLKVGATYHFTNFTECIRGVQFRYCVLSPNSNNQSCNPSVKLFEERKCDQPTPTVTPTVTPTATPSATPTPTVTPEPTQVPEHKEPGLSMPVCEDGNVLDIAANFHVYRDGSHAVLKWIPTGGEKVNIYYKEVHSQNWQYGVPDAVNNGYFLIGDLDPKLGYTFGVEQRRGCSGGKLATAVVIDDPKPMLFKFSYWTW